MIENILKNHQEIKSIAGQLKLDGITVNVRYQGKTLVKVGAGAEPFMLGIVGDVEIVDMESAAKLADSLGALS